MCQWHANVAYAPRFMQKLLMHHANVANCDILANNGVIFGLLVTLTTAVFAARSFWRPITLNFVKIW